jgi:hypothetical protein
MQTRGPTQFEEGQGVAEVDSSLYLLRLGFAPIGAKMMIVPWSMLDEIVVLREENFYPWI